MQSFNGVYEKGKMGLPYFNPQPVKVFEAMLSGEPEPQYDQFNKRAKG